MSAEAATLNPESLMFAQSESKAVGIGGRLMTALRANSPRVIGSMKLIGDVTVGVVSKLDPFLATYMVLAGLGRVIMIAYGSKSHQQKLTAEKEGKEHEKTNGFAKVLKPRQYPIEAAAGLSVIAEAFGIAYGVAQFAAGATGFTPIILGSIAVLSYAYMLFGKEGKESAKNAENPEPDTEESLVFQQSKSTPVGWWQKTRGYMKGNPVFASSMVNTVISAGMLIGGIIEGLPAYAVAGVIFVVANAMQAFLVRKREFNVEGALEDKKQTEAENQGGTGYAARITEQRRGREGEGPAMAPA